MQRPAHHLLLGRHRWMSLAANLRAPWLRQPPDTDCRTMTSCMAQGHALNVPAVRAGGGSRTVTLRLLCEPDARLMRSVSAFACLCLHRQPVVALVHRSLSRPRGACAQACLALRASLRRALPVARAANISTLDSRRIFHLLLDRHGRGDDALRCIWPGPSMFAKWR